MCINFGCTPFPSVVVPCDASTLRQHAAPARPSFRDRLPLRLFGSCASARLHLILTATAVLSFRAVLVFVLSFPWTAWQWNPVEMIAQLLAEQPDVKYAEKDEQ